MPDSQNVAGCAGSNTIEEPRFVICCAPAVGQSCCQLVPPSVLDQSPCFATVVMSMSVPGCDARYDVLPHSDGMPARFAVTFTHIAGGVADTGCVPPAPVWGGSVTLMSPPPPSREAAPAAPVVPPVPAPTPAAEEQAAKRRTAAGVK